jgi:2-polyprenyl-3-methyl-5-hydroxy-6-metoxy-1,4-benzoquinol methylase
MAFHEIESINCRVCDTLLMNKYIFREMMFGYRDKFPYGECENCGCIQIMSVPTNIDKYYPSFYVSFTQKVDELKRKPIFKRLIADQRIIRKYKKSENETLKLLHPLLTLPRDRILDIGCGKGALICRLFNLGFEHVTGVDKFIDKQIDYNYGVQVLKKELTELIPGSFDLLIMIHVLEHVDDQIKQLKDCHQLLSKNGKLLISLPILGDAWNIYKENWVQLDVPRHFVLHTLKSLAMLSEQCGFKIEKTVFDSTVFQFLGSELYQQDIPLTLPDTHEWFPFESKFSNDQISSFQEKTMILNKTQRGDTATFYLSKI